MATEKKPLEDLAQIEAPSVDNGDIISDQAAEIRARIKADCSVVPLLFLGLIVFQLDRMNLGSALTGGIGEAIGIDQNTVNLGNQMMFLGIVVLEIPSNLLLQRIGPRIWMATQVFIFGFISTMQVFLVDRNGFLVSRAILGLAEAGYIPGAIYTLSTWFSKRELAKRVALLFFGMFGGNAISPLLGAGLLKLDGVRGLTGWQWIFLIEGVFTISVSIMLLFFLPGSPDNPKPLLFKGFIRFSEEEQIALRRRLEIDDAEKKGGSQGLRIPLRVVGKTIVHWRRWPHFVSTALVFSTWSPLTTYSPTIIVSLGFEKYEANALCAVGGLLSLVVVFFFAWLSDRTTRRGVAVMTAISCYLIVLVCAKTIHPHVGKWSRFGLWTAINAFAVGYHPIHNTWVQVNCKEPGERSVSIAMWVMSAISGLMAGTQIFRGEDAPFYSKGLTTMIALVTCGLVMAGVQKCIYVMHNRRVRERGLQSDPETRIYVP